ncbi:Lrp/AsnC family transcriptional regulator [Actinoallomurus rhizosphaericola]|uniref:Lrp/AsnC family transcriptional regulator n=1 Tax=Actinoallomurus rhizosphaericola TaxID=2952536 RepID=UPI0020930B4B|nr:Lrp/AsnC family transcriptional regulator [Actinoallomurus rhizosphaericola]MCO5997343.1 Lrp/AsnC family transcriptional regulator [Actinoallomurus rhizosphaericola]
MQLDERDLQLLHALQIAPRVTWTDAARILRAGRSSLVARWTRLRSAGLAWVSAQPGAGYRDVTLSLVEVDCLPGKRPDVLRAVCRDPRVVTVEESTRGRDLLLTVITHDLPELTVFLLDHLESLPGVARQRSHVATRVHRHGSHWRLDALEPAQEAAFERIARRAPKGPGGRVPAALTPLIQALAQDGRASAADLARALGQNPATTRRQLQRVLRSGLLSFRCELAAEVSGWSVSSTWTARVEAADHDRAVTALASLPELRMCISTTGETNLAMTIWTRSVGDIQRIELLLGARLPFLRLRDNAINLRTPKRMGCMLDATGRSTGRVIVPSALLPR